ncbi:MAG: polynucleotide kinase-phosphatase [Planctomycetota bacterium]|nr:MAG: polynucleotide kinase-phosphatase [Planctomycetota bacterium]
MQLDVPDFSLVVLIGASGSGKSTFAATHFLPTEVVSSDVCRGLVSNDSNDQSATADAFALLHYTVGLRLKNRLLTVIDATNVAKEDRRKLIQLARQYHALPVAVVLDLPERLCSDRNALRPERSFGRRVVRHQRSTLRRNLRGLAREGFRRVWKLKSEQEVEAVEVVRQPLWNDKRHDHGPFDIIGDVHGCFDELVDLLQKLGYKFEKGAGQAEGNWQVQAPQTEEGAQRKVIFLGDLVDRGPKTPAVLRLVMAMVREGAALCVPGNHDDKLRRKLEGRKVKIAHGLEQSLAQLESESEEFLDQVRDFLRGLVSHYQLDRGRLVVAHAGLKEDMQGRGSGQVRQFCLYGETSGETDEFGLPVRYPWAMDYRGRATVVYGHTPVPEPEWLNRTICVDTGCVFGGMLTALRYPEKETVSVPARQTYAQSVRPFDSETEGSDPPGSDSSLSAQQLQDHQLDLEDVRGKRFIQTRLRRNIRVHEENSAAALESMSRFATDPRWLIYLPPTMSPSETSSRSGMLEHPDEAFATYRNAGVSEVICQEKHMGSRAVVILCRDPQSAERRFGVDTGEIGVVITRTGRRFFDDLELEHALLSRLQMAAEGAGLWAELSTDWLCLDAELMPWSAKAQALLRDQYAAVGSAATASLEASLESLSLTRARLHDEGIHALWKRQQSRQESVARYCQAYRQYCWPVQSLEDLKLAPFHLLASEGAVHADQDHFWHMEILARFCAQDSILLATQHRSVSLADLESCKQAEDWWQQMTAAGGEGMVVKPKDFVAKGKRGLLQPAVKCRGSEYLRIIYGPEYLMPEHLERLRKRGLGRKRSLALREFALGLEALERFVRREPLRRVHECVFAVLALESEPVDPRL